MRLKNVERKETTFTLEFTETELQLLALGTWCLNFSTAQDRLGLDQNDVMGFNSEIESIFAAQKLKARYKGYGY